METVPCIHSQGSGSVHGKESRKKSIFTQIDESYYLCDDWWGCFNISNNRCTENCCQNHFDRHFGCLLVTHYWNWINENIRCIHVCECITDVWFIVYCEQCLSRGTKGGGREELDCYWDALVVLSNSVTVPRSPMEVRAKCSISVRSISQPFHPNEALNGRTMDNNQDIRSPQRRIGRKGSRPYRFGCRAKDEGKLSHWCKDLMGSLNVWLNA